LSAPRAVEFGAAAGKLVGMFQSAEALLLLAFGLALFRVLRPLRDRLERWYARWLPAPRNARVVRMRRGRSGAYEAEDSDDRE
jgi:hypothetical protein